MQEHVEGVFPVMTRRRVLPAAKVQNVYHYLARYFPAQAGLSPAFASEVALPEQKGFGRKEQVVLIAQPGRCARQYAEPVHARRAWGAFPARAQPEVIIRQPQYGLCLVRGCLVAGVPLEQLHPARPVNQPVGVTTRQ